MLEARASRCAMRPPGSSCDLAMAPTARQRTLMKSSLSASSSLTSNGCHLGCAAILHKDGRAYYILTDGLSDGKCGVHRVTIGHSNDEPIVA